MPRADRRRRGSISVEFGFVAPILLVLAMGTTDLVRYMRAQMRTDAAAQQLAQLVSQCNRITAPGDLDQFWAFTQSLIGSSGTVTGTGANGAVILSAVGRVSGANRVTWQRRTGSSTHASVIGLQGGTAAIRGGYQVPDGHTLFVAEVFLPRTLWELLGNFLGRTDPRVLRGATQFMSRAVDSASLQAAPASSTTADCTR